MAIRRVEEHREKGAGIRIEVLGPNFIGAERVVRPEWERLVEQAHPEVEQSDGLLFVQQGVDAEGTKCEITDQLRARADAELLAEGAGCGVTERYELAGSAGVFVDGLLRYSEEPPA